MSTNNIGFYEDLTKIIFELSSNTHLISSAAGCIKLVSHWDPTTSRLVGDKGLRYKRDFLPFFTLRSHWTL